MDAATEKDLPHSRKTRAFSAAFCWAMCCARRRAAQGLRMHRSRSDSCHPASGAPGAAHAPVVKREARRAVESTLSDRPERSMSCARFRISRIWSTSPRTCTRTGARRASMRSRARAPQIGSIAHALDQRGAGAGRRRALGRWFDDALVSPVLTAHPPSAAQSILDASARSRGCCNGGTAVALTPDEAARVRRPASTAQCWRCGRPRCCGCRKLRVSRRDRQRARLLPLHVPAPRCPKLYASAGTNTCDSASETATLPAAVPAPGLVDRRRPRRQSERRRAKRSATRFERRRASRSRTISGEVHRLGAELSLSTRLVHADRATDGAGARRPRRQSAPQGRALSAGA